MLLREFQACNVHPLESWEKYIYTALKNRFKAKIREINNMVFDDSVQTFFSISIFSNMRVRNIHKKKISQNNLKHWFHTKKF